MYDSSGGLSAVTGFSINHQHRQGHILSWQTVYSCTQTILASSMNGRFTQEFSFLFNMQKQIPGYFTYVFIFQLSLMIQSSHLQFTEVKTVVFVERCHFIPGKPSLRGRIQKPPYGWMHEGLGPLVLACIH